MPRTSKMTRYRLSDDEDVMQAIIDELPCDIEIDVDDVKGMELAHYDSGYELTVWQTSDSDE